MHAASVGTPHSARCFPRAALFILPNVNEASTPRGILRDSALPPTASRAPQVQAQYAYDRACERKLFGEHSPCAMGKMVFDVCGEQVSDERAEKPVLGHNRYPYAHFADQEVLSHRLLTPVQHVPDLSSLRDLHPAAWEAFHVQADELREAGMAVFIHGGGSQAMSVAAHVHAHVFELGDKLTAFHYDQATGELAVRAGGHWIVKQEAGSDPVEELLAHGWTPHPWEPQASHCDDRYAEVIAAAGGAVAQRSENRKQG